VYYAALAVGLVGLIACCCIKDYDPYFTSHVPRQIYKGGKEDAGAAKSAGVESGSSGSEVDQEIESKGEVAGTAIPEFEAHQKEAVQTYVT